MKLIRKRSDEGAQCGVISTHCACGQPIGADVVLLIGADVPAQGWRPIVAATLREARAGLRAHASWCAGEQLERERARGLH